MVIIKLELLENVFCQKKKTLVLQNQSSPSDFLSAFRKHMIRNDKDISTTKITQSISKFSVHRWFFFNNLERVALILKGPLFVFRTKTITTWCFNPLNAGSVSKKTPENNLIFPSWTLKILITRNLIYKQQISL